METSNFKNVIRNLFSKIDSQELINEEKELEKGISDFLKKEPIFQKIESIGPQHLSSALNLLKIEIEKISCQQN